MEVVPVSQNNSQYRFLSGGGEMGELMRSHDWEKTVLGSPSKWPQSLKTTVSTCINSKFPIFIWWGPDYAMLYNDGYRQILGEKHPRALGEKGQVVWSEIWHIIGPMLDAVMTKGIATWSENQLLLVSRYGFTEECYFTFSYSPIYEESGAIGGVFCAVTETTETVVNERQLKTLKDLGNVDADNKSLGALLTSTAEAISRNNKDFPFAVIYRINENHVAVPVEYAGIDMNQAVFPHEIDLNHPVEGMLNFYQAYTSRKVVVSENNGRRTGLPTGAWDKEATQFIHIPVIGAASTPVAIISAALNPFRKFNGSFQQFASLISDQLTLEVNNVLAYEEEKKRAEALAEIDKAKTVFFSNISHEFRTPLTLILGSLEHMLAEGQKKNKSPQKDDEAIQAAHRNAVRLLKLVNTLLDFSRIEAGRAMAKFQQTDIAKYTANLASTFRSTIESAGLKFSVECDPSPPDVFIDRDMWEKIVLNLLSNAYKFTLSGEIGVRLMSNENNVSLVVRDTGTGIPTQELTKIFERFHRVEQSAGRSYEGTGIGLSLVSELVKLHGGNISVSSREGGGSEFTVLIPRGFGHLPSEQIIHQTEKSPLLSSEYIKEILPHAENQFADAGMSLIQNSETILVVDDNADMRKHIRNLLEPDYNVITAANGKEALNQIYTHRPDLVVTDIMMPVMDGVQLLKAIKEELHLHQLPVILVSARAGEESMVEGYETGADDYVIKPFSAKELLARVRSQIRTAKKRNATENNLKNLFKQTPAMVHVLKGPDHVFDFFHPLGRDIVGGRDLTGMKVRDALPEFAEFGVFEIFDKVYQTGKPFNANELRIVTKNENEELTERYFETTFQPLFSEDKNVEGIMVFSFEVTDKVRARQQLEERQKELISLANAMPQLVWVAEPSGDVLYYNDRVAEFSGAVRNAEGSWRWEGMVHPEDAEDTTRAWLSAVQNKTVYEISHRIRMKDGNYRWHLSRGYPRFDENGGLLKWYGTATDIHEQKLTEENLKFNAALTETIADAVIGTTVVNNDYYIFSWNKGAEITYGWTAAEVLGKPVRGLLNTEFYSDEDRAAWPKALATDGYWKGEVRQQKKDGTVMNIMASVAAVHDKQGNIVSAVAVNRDITVQKKAEADLSAFLEQQIKDRTLQLEQLNRELERHTIELQKSNEDLQQFAHVASHDLKEPVRKIRTFSNRLKTEYGSAMPPRGQLFLEKIESSSERLFYLIEGILQYSTIDLTNNFTSIVDLNKVIAQISEDLEVLIMERNVQIDYDNLHSVYGSPVLMNQLFYNLINNAIKFSKKDVPPEIVISSKMITGRLPNSISNPAENFLEITVSDNGIGFEQEYAERIFKTFTRLNPKEQYDGTGLGLALCKKIVERHNGTIQAFGKKDEGAKFVIRLPASMKVSAGKKE